MHIHGLDDVPYTVSLPIFFVSLCFGILNDLYFFLKRSHSPARPAAAPGPASVSMFIHTAVQIFKKAGQKGKYYATLKSFTASLCRFVIMVASLIYVNLQITVGTVRKVITVRLNYKNSSNTVL